MKELEIFNYHGYKAQCKQLNEEVYEFIEAIYDLAMVNDYKCETDLGKFIQNRNKDNAIDELADVLLLLNQFVRKYDLSEKEIINHYRAKRKRELKRIGDGFYENKNN